MRIRDVHPGYLNRPSLLGEHRELPAVVSIIVNHKHGYVRHPETMRWRGYGWTLRQRPRLLAGIQRPARQKEDVGPLASTDLSELMAWLRCRRNPPAKIGCIFAAGMLFIKKFEKSNVSSLQFCICRRP